MSETATEPALWLTATFTTVRSSVVGRPLVWGAIGATCVMAGGTVVGPAPIALRGLFGRGMVQLAGLGLTYAGIVLLVAAWLGIGAEISAGRPPSRPQLMRRCAVGDYLSRSGTHCSAAILI